MQVILSEDVPHLGKTGDIVVVKEGYGRNYLIPQGLAVIASPKNKAKLEHDRSVIAAREAKLMRTAEAVKARIEGASVNIAKQVGEGDKLFGSVTAKEIAEELSAQGIEVDRKRIQLPENIRSLGEHQVSISLGQQMSASLKVWVVAK
jgi:large subunit ribosomal protein L9